LSISAATQVIEVVGDELRAFVVEPEDVGLSRQQPDRVPGGDPAENAATTRAIFAGEQGAARDLAVFNAGAAIYAAGGADSLSTGVVAAQQAIDSGAAARTLETFVQRTVELAG
jgi:anthranilate phosphoribosyltransferase